jgi:hypothetical protein
VELGDMAKAINDVVEEFQDNLRRMEQTHYTITWPEFYELNQILRFKNDRKEQLIDRAVSKGLIIGFGDSAIIICRDRNFCPIAE